MSSPDKGIDFFVSTVPWCMKLKDFAREVGLPTDNDETPLDD